MAKGYLEVSCNVPNSALLNNLCYRSVAYTVCGPQVFKFGCYVAIPIFMTAAFVTNPDRLAAIIKNVSQLCTPLYLCQAVDPFAAKTTSICWCSVHT